MPTATFDYVYFPSGPHTRQPRSAVGPGGFTLLQQIPPLTLEPGSQFTATLAPPTLTVGGKTYTFAFMNVSGGYTSASGGVPIGQFSTDASASPESVYAQDSPIVVLVVYIPVGGNGGVRGATIDSFDETTGTLFDDTFVSVSPDPTGTETTEGNVHGFVSTANSNETITALSPTSPSLVDFDQWVPLGVQLTTRIIPPNPILHTPGEVISTGPGLLIVGNNLQVDEGTSVSALAFYKAPPPSPPPPPPTTCEQLLANWYALEPKTDIVLLAYYEEKLSACQGPQYAAAVNEIKALIAELEHQPHSP